MRCAGNAARQEQALESLCRARTSGDQINIRRAEQAVVLTHLSVAAAVARRFQGRGVMSDDLEQLARLSLVQATRRWDPAISREFIPYAVPSMAGAIKRYFRDHLHVLRIPRRLQEINAAADQALQAVATDAGASPSAAALAGVIDHTVGDLDAARAARAAAQVADITTTGVDPGCDDDRYAHVERQLDLAAALHALDQRELWLIDLYYGQEWSQARIGAHIGVSQMQISRLLRAAVEKLRRHMAA